MVSKYAAKLRRLTAEIDERSPGWQEGAAAEDQVALLRQIIVAELSAHAAVRTLCTPPTMHGSGPGPWPDAAVMSLIKAGRDPGRWPDEAIVNLTALQSLLGEAGPDWTRTVDTLLDEVRTCRTISNPSTVSRDVLEETLQLARAAVRA